MQDVISWFNCLLLCWPWQSSFDFHRSEVNSAGVISMTLMMQQVKRQVCALNVLTVHMEEVAPLRWDFSHVCCIFLIQLNSTVLGCFMCLNLFCFILYISIPVRFYFMLRFVPFRFCFVCLCFLYPFIFLLLYKISVFNFMPLFFN